MKRIFLFIACIGMIGYVSLNAQQKCDYAKAYQTNSRAYVKSEASKAAAQYPNIEEQVSAQSGVVTYLKKEICATTGKVSYVDVEYCRRSGKFVSISPKKASQCSKSKKEYSHTKVQTAKVYQASGIETSTQYSAAQKAACAAACRKSKAVNTKSVKTAPTKLVKH